MELQEEEATWAKFNTSPRLVTHLWDNQGSKEVIQEFQSVHEQKGSIKAVEVGQA